MSSIFQRPELAESMANQLLNPGFLTKACVPGCFCPGCAEPVKPRFCEVT